MATTGTAIEVTTKFNFLQWILVFTKPTTTVDGTARTSSWGTQRFDVTAGSHTVQVAFRYLFLSQAGKNSLQVNVPEGQTVKVRYHAPWIVFFKGRMKVES